MHVKRMPVLYIMCMYIFDFQMASRSGSFSKHRNVIKDIEMFRRFLKRFYNI